eukprot:2173874-Rhodomonas_salina.2
MTPVSTGHRLGSAIAGIVPDKVLHVHLLGLVTREGHVVPHAVPGSTIVRFRTGRMATQPRMYQERQQRLLAISVLGLSLIHISEPTRPRLI